LPFDKGYLDTIPFKVGARGCWLELPMESTEDIYGFGLQLHSVNQAGRKKFIRVNSDPVANTGESHAPAPFYLSTRGYGLYVDTSRYVSFYMGANAKKGVSKDIKEEIKVHEEFSENALYALKKAKEQRQILIDIPAVKGVDIYLFAGPEIKTALMRCNMFSGSGCLPPMWGLGMWYRAYGGSNQEHVLKLADYFRENEIPVDVMGLEPGWHTHSYSCSYKWNKLMFEKPQEMIDALSDKKYKINLWEHIFVHPTAEIYKELMDYSGDYEVWNGLVPDFATKQANDIFIKHHTENFIEKGILGFKLDECDNSDYNPSCWSFPNNAEFPSGLDGEQMHNLIGLLYQKTLYKAFKAAGKRTLSQVRSSGPLASGMPFVLYSDLYNHRQFIKGMLNAGFSGLLWAPEVRGCKSTDDLIRRIQTAVFSHHALLNCWRIPSPPWQQVDTNKNLAGQFQENEAEVTAICKRLFETRMSLVPYLYSAFARYYKTGFPTVRALVLDFEADENTHNIEDEYMIGDALLVAPLVEEDGNKRSIYLPEGIWYDFWTNEKYEGGKRFDMEVPIETIPVFVKDNAIVPLAKPVQSVDEATVFELSIKCYGDGQKHFELFEDDGVSFEYENNKYNTIMLTEDGHNNIKVSKTGEFAANRYEIKAWEFIK
jgi:alpha-D-xyloside xylohydrolase